MRAPFQEGEFPGPVKYGYLNVGAVEEGPAELRGRTVFCLYPHQTAYVVPARRRIRRARGRPARSGRARRHGRDRRQRAVGCRPGSRRPGRRRGRRDGRLLCRPAAAAATRPCASLSSTSIPAAPKSRQRSASTSPCRTTRRAISTSSCTRARRPRASSARSTCSARRARSSISAGTATPRFGCRWAERSTPAVSPSARARSASSPRLAPHAARAADRLALALELLRDPAFDALLTGESRFDELPDVMARLAAGSLPALCHTITYGEA